MKILALDSSGLVASVAVVADDVLLAEYTVNYKKTHSQTLLPMLNEVARMIELDLHSIDAIAVAAGPGSFTGLRIGSATAKGLGFALEKPLVHIPTVDALACNLYGYDGYICPLMDARRNQVYTGIYCFENGCLRTLEAQSPMAVEEIIGKLNALGKKVVFLGDGVPVYQELLEKWMEVPFAYAPAHMNRQRAASVAFLASQYIKEGKTESAADHVPDYLRMSQAERERAEAQKRSAEPEKGGIISDDRS
ncbi:MAG: tRNA (adenosine(37)-N6)-threonylcarbamoyltransferase complex dimerization subunit type 1 TsaB [Lachnospiraceae bacterium]|jgi:tRNA threonylcarbamoyladenosine biosynthesis protein TsaB|nr:tRNA (adenosine(37)-N6)-threonylcarbamoyltransferase complex dimerization subunit type 1 TsaB [Lachnospiraceae bacterium]